MKLILSLDFGTTKVRSRMECSILMVERLHFGIERHCNKFTIGASSAHLTLTNGVSWVSLAAISSPMVWARRWWGWWLGVTLVHMQTDKSFPIDRGVKCSLLSCSSLLISTRKDFHNPFLASHRLFQTSACTRQSSVWCRRWRFSYTPELMCLCRLIVAMWFNSLLLILGKWQLPEDIH